MFISRIGVFQFEQEGYAHLFYNLGYELQCRLKGDVVWLDLDKDTFPILVAEAIEYRIANDN